MELVFYEINNLLEVATPNEGLLPFGYYSRTGFVRLPIAFLQKSNAVDLEESPPCLGSLF